MSQPLLIFDGDCGFCRRWIAYWQILTEGRVTYAAYQAVADQHPQIPRAEFENSVWLVEQTPAGKKTITRAAEAVVRALAVNAVSKPYLRWPFALYQRMPGMKYLMEFAYNRVAKNRVFFSRATSLLWGESIEPVRYEGTRALFLRGMGLVYFAAFASFAVQAQAIIGPRGIFPSGLSSGAVTALWAAGMGAAFLILVNHFTRVALLSAWLAYLAVVQYGQVFFQFQWDALLLEMGFFSLILAHSRGEPSRLAVWLLRWVLFKVVFFSGWVKLASGDPTWSDLTALKYHFETQPLPTWVGWWVHQLPLSVLKWGTVAMFFVELLLPLLFFLPRRARFFAAIVTVLLQCAIGLTGNYGFFGLEVCVLSLLLLDDQWIREHWGEQRLRGLKGPTLSLGQRPAHTWVLVLALGSAVLGQRFGLPWVQSYGVFAVMTQQRAELVIEGSLSGAPNSTDWAPYEFRWKPGDLKRRPGFVPFHMPRVDWQLWFAALGGLDQNGWVLQVARRILEGAPEVLNLFEKTPFGGRAPQALRVVQYPYQMTSPNEREATQQWWKRGEPRLYLPAVTLRNSIGAPD